MKKGFKIILNTVPRPILIRLSYAVRPILAFILRGDKFTDPIDGKRFKSFLPYGYGNQRNNVLSPATLSLERHRLLWLYLQNETNFFSSESLTERKKSSTYFRKTGLITIFVGIGLNALDYYGIGIFANHLFGID